MPNAAAEIFRTAAAANRDDPRRHGNLVHLEPGVEVVVAGDIHGNRTTLNKLIASADLERHENRRLILQEIVHGPLDPRTQQDRSIEPLLRAARLKAAHPAQVLFLLGNHDIAQVSGGEITKEGRRTCVDFVEGVKYAYRDDAQEVLDAVYDFLLSLPLAIRCPGGTFLAHSLPSPKRMDKAGVEILARPYTADDLRRGEPVYEWTWGRGQTPEQIDALAAQLHATFFVLGHRHVPNGWELVGGRALTLASDHEHGMIVIFGSDEALTNDRVMELVRPVAGL